MPKRIGFIEMKGRNRVHLLPAALPEPISHEHSPDGDAMEPCELLPKAIAFAHEKHREQKDRQGLPYILHPLAVLVNVTNHERYDSLTGAEKTDIGCIAILHDVVEDTDARLEDIQALLGRREITQGVDAMTNYPGEPDEAYWSRVKENPLARIVKLCDISHNSDPARAVPDPAHRKRLGEKYARALAYLRFRD